MTTLQLGATNLLSPVTLCFALGLLATALRSDLRLPEPVFQALSIYLMLAIGLKGGAALSAETLADVARPALAAIGLSLLIPLWSYGALRAMTRFTAADAAALAAHYGSVSAVTFLAVLAWLDAAGIAYEPFATVLLALMEVPAIVVALLLAGKAQDGGAPLGQVVARTLTGKSVVLLVGGIAIGYVVGKPGFAPVKPLFGDLFLGLLCLFMLELGVQAAQRVGDLRHSGLAIIAFALCAPLLNGLLGALVAVFVGLSQGGAIVLATLAASASYIVAPAAIRMALPQANPSLYLTASLAITFPFNLTLGIPIYAAIVRLLIPG